MSQEYIEEFSGALYVKGTRVSLENVYGAITYYLANQDKIEQYLKARAEQWEEFRKSADPLPASLPARLESTRR